MKNVLYQMEPPKELGYGLKTADFFVPRTKTGSMTAEFIHKSRREEEIQLFKRAQEMGTKDLSEAYVDLKDVSDEVDQEEKRREELRPDKDESRHVEVELEPAIEKDIAGRKKERNVAEHEDFNHPNDVILFKTWLDD